MIYTKPLSVYIQVCVFISLQLLVASEEAGCELTQLCFIFKQVEIPACLVSSVAMMPDNLPTFSQHLSQK